MARKVKPLRVSTRKEKYEFEGVALRRKVVSDHKRHKCEECFLFRKECYIMKPNGEDFAYDCYSRPSTYTSYIFVRK